MLHWHSLSHMYLIYVIHPLRIVYEGKKYMKKYIAVKQTVISAPEVHLIDSVGKHWRVSIDGTVRYEISRILRAVKVSQKFRVRFAVQQHAEETETHAAVEKIVPSSIERQWQ